MPSTSPDQHQPPLHRSSRLHGHATAEPEPVAEGASFIHHNDARRHRSRSAGPRRGPAVAPGLGGAQSPRKSNDGGLRGLETLETCGGWNVAVLVGLLAIATLCVYFQPTSPTNINIPISTLRQGNVTIKAAPFPINDLVTVAELYANASDDLYRPHRTSSNLTLRLDAPGLARVNVASWLSKLWLDPTNMHDEGLKKRRGLPAVNVPILVDIVNITVTLKMLHDLWPVVIFAASDVLVLGLGREHAEYPALRDSLAAFESPQPHDYSSTSYAEEIWQQLTIHANHWSGEAHNEWLWRIMTRLESIAEERAERATTQDMGNSTAFRLELGLQVPTVAQLLDHDRGRQQALPTLLADLGIAHDAFSQMASMRYQVSRRDQFIDKLNDYGLGRDQLCSAAAGDLLDALIHSGGQCRGNDTQMHRPKYILRPDEYSSRECLGGFWNALCDSDVFLSSVAALAGHVRDRARATVKERGTISAMREYIAGSSKDGIARRTAALDRALHVLDQLRSAMRLQRQLLVSMATRMRSACILQDELRYSLRALSKQSAWWDLEWDANSKNASLAFVTFPAPEDTITQLRAAMARLGARDELVQYNWYTDVAAHELEKHVLAGWLERLDLGGLPRDDWWYRDHPKRRDTWRTFPPGTKRLGELHPSIVQHKSKT